MDERAKCFEVLLESIKESLIIKFMRKITDEINDTHMEELALYWKNSLKYKVGCFWRYLYVYTIN